MSATKRYYADLACTLTDEQLKEHGYSDEEIQFFRECFGPYEDDEH